MKLQKFKFCTGLCGMNVLYTNIIKAANAEEAAKIYFDSIQKQYTEEDVREMAKGAILIEDIVRKADGFYDVIGKKIEIGETVAFVHNYEGSKLRVNKGEVSRFTKAKVFVKLEDGTEYGFVSDADSKVKRIAKLRDRTEKGGLEDAMDAIGQKIQVGDEIVYLGSVSLASYGSYFIYGGRVTEIGSRFLKADKIDGRKIFKNIVVV